MITHVLIRNFKGIRQCEISDLGEVNLFIGKNDSCKSTILEAVYCTLKEFSQPSLRDTLGRRTNVAFGARELWYAYDNTLEIRNVVVFDNSTINLSVKYDQKSNSINSILRLLVMEGKSKTPKAYQGPTTSYFGVDFTHTGSSRPLEYLDALAKQSRPIFQSYLVNSKFIDSSTKSNVRYIETLLRDIKLLGRDREFGRVLDETFHVGRYWEFVPHPDFPNENRVATKVGKKFRFLGGFGDGIRFGMAIIAESIMARNTALFIEELENNQHPASIVKIVSFLVNVARKNKLQLFITTHSPFVWRYFDKAFETPTEIKKRLHCYEVIRDSKNGNVNCKRLDPEKPAESWTDVDKNLYEW
jgi:AAA15 family ATPase/GTPase